MNLAKSTRYALYAVIELARAAENGHLVVASRIAERYRVPSSVMAKVFQQLGRRGIAVGTRGRRGGHRLARPASEITLLDVIDAFEPRPAVPRRARSTRSTAGSESPEERRLGDVLYEVDELVRCTFASISLETLIARRARA